MAIADIVNIATALQRNEGQIGLNYPVQPRTNNGANDAEFDLNDAEIEYLNAEDDVEQSEPQCVSVYLCEKEKNIDYIAVYSISNRKCSGAWRWRNSQCGITCGGATGRFSECERRERS